MPLKPAALLDELKSNSRLRWGLLGIVGILWFYGILELRDQVQAKEDGYRSLSKKIARIQGTAAQTEWPTRLADARKLQGTLEKPLWRETSIGLAQASFNDWLSQLNQQANLGKVQQTVAAQGDDAAPGKETAAASSSGLWKLSAKLSFDFNPLTFYPWLGKLEKSDRQVIVESMTIRSLPSPKAEVMLVAYFLKQKPVADAEAASADTPHIEQAKAK